MAFWMKKIANVYLTLTKGYSYLTCWRGICYNYKYELKNEKDNMDS